MKTIIRIRASAILLLMAGLLYGCSADMAEQSVQSEMDEPAKVIAVDISNGMSTRALNMELKSFALSVYNMKKDLLYIDKMQLTKDEGSGEFTGAAWSMLNTEMKAICVSPNMDVVTNLTFDKEHHSFDYEVPTSDQTMVKIGANMSFTKKSVSNKLPINFVNSLALLTVRARNELEVKDKEGNILPVTIYVKSCTLHNMGSKGTFTYTSNITGDWELTDGVVANYPQIMENAIELSTKKYINVMDSTFTLIPQAPENNAWTPAGTDDAPEEDAISVANTNKKAYIELKCAMTTVIDDKTVYIWGDIDNQNNVTYESVYFPYKGVNCPRAWDAINKQGVYNLHFVNGEALDKDGKPIKPQSKRDGDTFQDAEFINISPMDENGDDWVDDWPDPTSEDIEF